MTSKKMSRDARFFCGVSLGLTFGPVIGIALDNLAVGVSLGVTLGGVLGFALRGRKKDDGEARQRAGGDGQGHGRGRVITCRE